MANKKLQNKARRLIGLGYFLGIYFWEKSGDQESPFCGKISIGPRAQLLQI